MSGAFLFSLCYEMPFVNLDKLFLSPRAARHNEQKNAAGGVSSDGYHKRSKEMAHVPSTDTTDASPNHYQPLS